MKYKKERKSFIDSILNKKPIALFLEIKQSMHSNLKVFSSTYLFVNEQNERVILQWRLLHSKVKQYNLITADIMTWEEEK